MSGQQPTVVGNSETVVPGASIPLSQLFTSFPASGDTIVGFDVKQETANGGYLTDNGAPESPGFLYGNTASGIPIADIGQWAFVAGPAGTSDTIGFNADQQDGSYNLPSAYATVTSQATSPPTNSVPTLSSVSPTWYPADNTSRTMQLFVSNFVSGDTLTDTNPQGNTYDSVAPELTFVSSGEIDYQISDNTPMVARWTGTVVQEAAKCLRQLRAHKYLPFLQAALDALQGQNENDTTLAPDTAAAWGIIGRWPLGAFDRGRDVRRNCPVCRNATGRQSERGPEIRPERPACAEPKEMAT